MGNVVNERLSLTKAGRARRRERKERERRRNIWNHSLGLGQAGGCIRGGVVNSMHVADPYVVINATILSGIMELRERQAGIVELGE